MDFLFGSWDGWKIVRREQIGEQLITHVKEFYNLPLTDFFFSCLLFFLMEFWIQIGNSLHKSFINHINL